MKTEFCARCESVGRESKRNAKHEFRTINGVTIMICDKCLEEIEEEEMEKMYFLYEIQEDENAS